MAIPRKSRNTSSSPSTPPSPAPASGNSKTASSNKASQNSGAPVPGVLLGLSGGWLVARMFFFGGTLWLIEIIAISVAAGFVYPKGGKVQKRFATAIITVALLNLFVPGINPRIKSLRESQLNPPPPTEQSAGQEQVSPAPIEEIPSTGRVVVAGRKITLTGDGTYTVPAGRKSLCFTALGKIDGSEITDQTLDIIDNDKRLTLSTLGSKCIELPTSMKGSIRVDFFPNESWGKEPVLSKMYKRYRSMPGGQGEWPVIRIGE